MVRERGAKAADAGSPAGRLRSELRVRRPEPDGDELLLQTVKLSDAQPSVADKTASITAAPGPTSELRFEAVG